MLKYLTSTICGLMIAVAASSLALASESRLSSVANYLSAAESALTQASKLDQTLELEDALHSIHSVSVSFLDTAYYSLREAFKISPRPETKVALDRVSDIGKSYLGDASKLLAAAASLYRGNAQELASAQSIINSVLVLESEKQLSQKYKDDSIVEILLSLFGPILAACTALAVLIES